ncbi:MAG: hypothetical protein MPK06_00290 [Alphaproteobacteria bacterium]|nr:hypothetical protein [Alphaproteobacteria bacterium]MDA8004981.1 hypothetical protein [Alphaproteobacteria bacterium]
MDSPLLRCFARNIVPASIVSRETIEAGDMCERYALPHIPRRGCRLASDTL